MVKIPVWKTIVYAYSFTFGNLGAIIGLIWIPTVVLTVAAFFTLGNYLDDMQVALSDSSAGAAAQALFLLFAFALLALACMAMAAVPVIQQALGSRRGSAVAHFAFGAAELRLAGAFLVLILAMLAVVTGAGLTAGIVIAIAAAVAGQVPMVTNAAVVLGILAALVMLYAAIRFSFLLTPQTVAEQKIDLLRAWTLTQGNFWRIVAVLLAIAVPVLLVESVLEWAVIGVRAPLAGAGSDTAEIIVQLRAMREHLPVLLGISLFLMPFRMGLQLGAMAAAYSALVSPAARKRRDG